MGKGVRSDDRDGLGGAVQINPHRGQTRDQMITGKMGFGIAAGDGGLFGVSVRIAAKVLDGPGHFGRWAIKSAFTEHGLEFGRQDDNKAGADGLKDRATKRLDPFVGMVVDIEIKTGEKALNAGMRKGQDFPVRRSFGIKRVQKRAAPHDADGEIRLIGIGGQGIFDPVRPFSGIGPGMAPDEGAWSRRSLRAGGPVCKFDQIGPISGQNADPFGQRLRQARAHDGADRCQQHRLTERRLAMRGNSIQLILHAPGAVADRVMQNDDDLVRRNIRSGLKEMVQNIGVMDQHQPGLNGHCRINPLQQPCVQKGADFRMNRHRMAQDRAAHHHQAAGKAMADGGAHLHAHRR